MKCSLRTPTIGRAAARVPRNSAFAVTPCTTRVIVRSNVTGDDRIQFTAQPALNEAPEAVQAVAPPQYAQYPQQVAPPRPEYYVAAPPVPPVYPSQPVYQQQSSSSIPWWVWMGAGILVANVARLVQDLVKKGPQAMMAEMAMKQMMKSMGQPGAPGAAGANPFAAAAAAAGAGGPSPFGPYGATNPFSPNFTPPVDTTATAVPQAAQSPAAPATPTAAADPSAARGEKFAARVGSPSGGSSTNAATAAVPVTEQKPAAAVPPPTNGSSSSSSTAKVDVVEPVVKEPTGGSSSSNGPKAAAFFTDVGADASASSSSGSSGTAAQDPAQMTEMMEKMLRDPNMQKMLYPYLPEPMRNPDSIEWMLNNPEVRKQMEQVFAQSGMGMSPEMMNMMSQMDFSQEKVQQQFNELGLKPEDVIQKVLATPDLASGFSNPKVQQAIFDISQNPMNITKYQNDPEVMKVLEKVTEIFAPQMQGQQ